MTIVKLGARRMANVSNVTTAMVMRSKMAMPLTVSVHTTMVLNNPNNLNSQELELIIPPTQLMMSIVDATMTR